MKNETNMEKVKLFRLDSYLDQMGSERSIWIRISTRNTGAALPRHAFEWATIILRVVILENLV